MLQPEWTGGFTQDQLDDAQARYRLTFPPDLVAALRERRLVGGYDWSTENQAIRGMLAWPFDMLSAEIDHGYWWPDWGDRPREMAARRDVLRQALAAAPKLIPLLGHRFLPATPIESGNPVLSMYGFDTVYYGADLADYWRREFDGPAAPIGTVRHIPFWSDLAERWQELVRIDD
ncbi:MAG: hypothetical protein ACTHJR_06275 [Sphingomonas sp.]|uniref:hypothetical protein n=1 Tax=Sphingomonas sp. TaxID=28214 RepID=UPI003F804167